MIMRYKRHNPIVASVLCLVLCIGVNGCAVAVIAAAGAGAVGGYAIGRDTFEGITARGQDEIWEAANRVTSIMGSAEDNDRKQGTMSARINGAHVTVTIIPINLTTTKLRIKARQLLFPRIGIAQEVYAKIINQLEQ